METIDGITIVTETISTSDVEEIAKQIFGDMAKGVVDVRLRVLALGGELHADAERLLLDKGSSQGDLWGINFYPASPRERWVEFDSMINIRPSQGNRSRSVEDEAMRKTILGIVDSMITG